jgi:hypothetical protein
MTYIYSKYASLPRFQNDVDWLKYRLSTNRPTKREKEKSRSNGHCQCEKEMDDHLLACQPILEIEPGWGPLFYKDEIIN